MAKASSKLEGSIFVKGVGIQPEGAVVGKPADFTIYARGLPLKSDVQVKILDPENKEIAVTTTRKDDLYHVIYTPQVVGLHEVRITSGGTLLTEGPYLVHTLTTLDKKEHLKHRIVSVLGRGMRRCHPGIQALFSIDMLGLKKNLEISITHEGKREDLDFQVAARAPDSYDITYTPTFAGRYMVQIESGGSSLPECPIYVESSPGPRDAKLLAQTRAKILCSGTGVMPDGPRMYVPARFEIRLGPQGPGSPDEAISRAGDSPNDSISVYCYDVSENGKPLVVLQHESGPGVIECDYTPRSLSRHIIYVLFKEIHVPGSPFRVVPKKPSVHELIHVGGQGTQRAMRGQTNEFFVEFYHQGPGLGLFMNEKLLEVEIQHLAPGMQAGQGRRVNEEVSLVQSVERAPVMIEVDAEESKENREKHSTVEKVITKRVRATYLPASKLTGALSLSVKYEGALVGGTPFIIPIEDEYKPLPAPVHEDHESTSL